MKIAFQTNQLSIRGTEIAIYDYANNNEIMLNNDSYIVVKERHTFPHDEIIIKKFKDRFKDRLYFYKNANDMQSFLDRNNIDIFYSLKAGVKDEAISNGRKNCIHTVFQFFEPHGDVYAYISEWLTNKMTGGKYPFVPHMIDMNNHNKNWRKKLNIPNDAVVLGCYGGENEFNIPFVRQAINNILNKRKDIYFLFANINPNGCNFCNVPLLKHDRMIIMPGIHDLNDKISFINSCDGMIHARLNGESFGLAIAEFSILNKPIITWTGKDVKKYFPHPHDLAHIEALGDKSIHYNDYNDIYSIFENFQPQPDKNWDAYSELYNPKVVMEKFKKVFLD